VRIDVVEVEILEDGQVKWTTSKISAPNHSSADRLLAEVGRLLGGEEKIEHRHGRAAHSHSHSQQVRS